MKNSRYSNLSLAAVLGLALAATGQTTNPDLKRLQDEARQQQMQYQQRMPLLDGVFKISDVYHVSLRDGWPVLASKLPPLANPQSRLNVEGLRDVSYLSMSRDGSGEVVSFSFINQDFSSDAAIQSTTSVSYSSHNFSVSRDVRAVAGYHHISLSIRGQAGAANVMVGAVQTPPVQMMVRTHGGAVANQQVTAQSIDALRRDHRQEFEQHIRPLFRELRLESLLAADPIIAWQVFRDEWRPDEKTAAAVKKLLADIDADDFLAREAATEQLKGMGRDAALVLAHADRRNLSAQQQSVVDLLMSPLMVLPESEAQRLRADPEFLVDCLNTDDARMTATALKHLRRVTRLELAFDAGDSEETRSAAVDKIREAVRQATTRPAPKTSDGSEAP